MKSRLSHRVNRDILLTFAMIAICFIVIGFLMQVRWRNDNVETVFQLLDSLVAREQDALANELFEERFSALEMRLQELLTVKHITSIQLYDATRRPVVAIGKPITAVAASFGPGDKPFSASDVPASPGYEVQGVFRTFLFVRPITAVGETFGWIVISYDLSLLRQQLQRFFMFLAGILLVTLLGMLTLLRRRLHNSVIVPLEHLGEAMKRMQAGQLPDMQRLDGAAREIIRVGDAFQAMTDRLNRSYRELDETNRALRESERRFKSIFDYAPFAIVVNRQDDGRLLDANEAFRNHWGLTHDHDVGEIRTESLAMITDYQAASIRAEALEHGALLNRQLAVRRPDGSFGQILYASVPISFGDVPSLLTMTVDITEQKHIEEELRVSREKFATLFELSPEAILLVRLGDEQIQDVNSAFIRLFGYPREQCLGRTTRELGLYQDNAERERIFVRLRNGEAVENFEVGVKNQDGNALLCSLSSVSLTINNEQFLLTVMRNITEARVMQEMMIQTEKMISMGGIAAGIAHEINNPLGIIVQAVQNMSNRVRSDFPKNRQVADDLGLDLQLLHDYFRQRKIDVFIEDIQGAALRAAAIVRHMLDFSRRSDAQCTRCDIKQLLQRALNLARSDYDLKKSYDFRKIRVAITADESLPSILCVETEIEQVLLNLLRNAAQAIAAADPPILEPRIGIEAHATADVMCLAVSDNGPGIQMEVQRRIFEPFFTTKSPGIGTGLGLSVSYFIITRNHRGSLRVESPLGGGTRFVIELPLQPAAGDDV